MKLDRNIDLSMLKLETEFEENINGKIETYDYLNRLKELNEDYDSLELKLKALPKKLDIEIIQYKYF